MDVLWMVVRKITQSLKIDSIVKNTKFMMRRAFFVQLKDLSYQGLYFTVNQKLLILDSLGKISVAHVLLTKYFYFNSILFYS